MELTARSNFEEVQKMLARIVPANLLTDVQLKYNQHRQLTAYTHDQLSVRTHGQLREEVLNLNGYRDN